MTRRCATRYAKHPYAFGRSTHSDQRTREAHHGRQGRQCWPTPWWTVLEVVADAHRDGRRKPRAGSKARPLRSSVRSSTAPCRYGLKREPRPPDATVVTLRLIHEAISEKEFERLHTELNQIASLSLVSGAIATSTSAIVSTSRSPWCDGQGTARSGRLDSKLRQAVAASLRGGVIRPPFSCGASWIIPHWLRRRVSGEVGWPHGVLNSQLRLAGGRRTPLSAAQVEGS